MGFFDFLFGKNKSIEVSNTSIENLFTPYFTGNYDPELNTTYTSICDAHARHLSKLKPKVFYKDEPSNNKKRLNELLTLRMNPHMSASTAIEMIAREYFMTGTSLVYIERDYTNLSENIVGFWPLDPDKNSLQTMKKNGRLLIRFVLDGKTRTIGEEDLLILVRNAKPSSFFGQMSKSIDTVLKVIQTQYEGIDQAIRVSAFVRFLISGSTVLKPEIKKQKAKDFAEAYLGADSTGVAFVDNAEKIIPVNSKPFVADEKQMEHFKKEIYSYLGANEKILTASFTENEWQAYYESSLEPFVVKLLDELNYKILTPNERASGNKVKADVNPIQTASFQTRINIANVMLKLPVVKPNQIADLLYLPRLENGDKEFGFLNYTDADKMDEYQDVDNQDKPVDRPSQEE